MQATSYKVSNKKQIFFYFFMIYFFMIIMKYGCDPLN